MNKKKEYDYLKNSIKGQAALELAMIIPMIIILVLAASQIGLLVHSKIILLQASRESVRIIATTNNNKLAQETAKRICGSDFEMTVGPGKASQRQIGKMVNVSISRSPGGLVEILEDILGKDLTLRAESSMRMECDQVPGN
jgi:hypothetical protein